MSIFGKRTVTVEMIEPEVLPKQELRRRAILHPEPTSEIKTLAEQAMTLLEYNVLAKHLGMGGPLACILRACNIPVLNEQEVERYQSYMRIKVAAKLNAAQEAIWKRDNITHYKEPIPEFVLRKAIQIKQRYQNANFMVEYLTVGFKSIDPFLIVCRGAYNLALEKYYIEVWDEPEFEAKM